MPNLAECSGHVKIEKKTFEFGNQISDRKTKSFVFKLEHI